MPSKLMIGRRAVIAGAVCALGAPVRAQDVAPRNAWPTAPIGVALPVAQGETLDAFMRALLGQMVGTLPWRFNLTDNPNIAATVSTAGKAEPDGYHLLIGTEAALAIAPELPPLPEEKPPEFEPIIGLCDVPLVFAVSRNLPARNLRDLTELTQGQPERYRYGSLGIGSLGHLAAELFKQRTRTVAGHKVFATSALLVQALVAGSIDFAILPIAPVWNEHRAGRLRVMALMGTGHDKALPGIRTLQESGVDDLEITGWFGCFAPAGIAAPTANLIADAFAAALRTEAGDRLCDLFGVRANLRDPAACRALIAADRALFAEVIRLGRLRRA
jgi:tripartite-type tricarboxylate transporter receptor subunit TctC